jgi:hypothetical protein
MTSVAKAAMDLGTFTAALKRCATQNPATVKGKPL